MSNKSDSDGSLGCLFFIGAAIVGGGIGSIYGAAWGWLFFGGALMSIAGFAIFLLVFAAIVETLRKRRA